MKSQSLRAFWYISLFCLVNNISLFAQYQLTPECDVDIDGNRYVIHFSLPYDYVLVEDTICDEIFSSIEFVGNVDYDVTDEAGYPALPFFSVDLLIPECVTDVWGYMEEESTSSEELDYFIQPAMFGSWITEDGEYVELDEECYNYEYYTTGCTDEYPDGYYMEYYSVSDIYTFLGVKGVTLSIHPFIYHPEGNLDVLREATIVVEFDCGDLQETINELQSQGTYSSYVAQLYYDTFNEEGVVNNSGENGRYLIVAAYRDFEMYLSPFVDYKRGQNYITEVVYLDELNLLGNSSGIKAYIDSNPVVSNPDFVLLVGNLSDIPPYEGANSTSNPYTDDGYHDFVGRWIIDETDDNGIYADLLRVVDKTMNTEMDYVDTYSTAALFSGTDDNSLIMSRSLYRNIERVGACSFAPMDIPYTLHDGRNYEPDHVLEDMIPILEGNTRFFMYTGHGNRFGIGQPYSLSYGDLPICSSPYPIGFGFACNMNSYTTNDNFAARWVVGANGGVAFLGSTVNTFLSPDNSFAKRIFKELKKLTNKANNFSLGVWLRISEEKYYNACIGPVRRRQVRKYNLIGDPTLAVYGMDYSGVYAPFQMPIKDKDDIEQSNLSTTSQICSIELYDIGGKRIASSNGEKGKLVEESLSSGVYIVKTTYTDGIVTTYKIIK